MVAPKTLFPVNRVSSPDELPDGFVGFLKRLHPKFTPWQERLVVQRRHALELSHKGHPPAFSRTELPDPDCRRELPSWCQDQRIQITGPADDAELFVKMMNSGAPGNMPDLEDSQANYWRNLHRGIQNARAALYGKLTYEHPERGMVGINPSEIVTTVRPRGLHMSQWGVFDEPVAAPLFDLALLTYQLDFGQLKRPLCIYIPKSESADEALWWGELFQVLACENDLPPDYIQCMALVEAHPMAYQMEKFIWNLREHILGLNLGRWDYMASLIHFMLEDPRWVLPDRDSIPHDVPFFQNLRKLMVETCHRHGILAIGGMTALFPDRTDPELDAYAKEVTARDKANEAGAGHDGAWIGHPDAKAIAIKQFPTPNQLHVRYPTIGEPDLRPLPTGVGTTSLEGTRSAITTAILYREGVLMGKGARLIRGRDKRPRMEDLATDRICRLMIDQRVRHRVEADGVLHTESLRTRLFDEALDDILAAPPRDTTPETAKKARQIAEEMIIREEFDPS